MVFFVKPISKTLGWRWHQDGLLINLGICIFRITDFAIAVCSRTHSGNVNGIFHFMPERRIAAASTIDTTNATCGGCVSTTEDIVEAPRSTVSHNRVARTGGVTCTRSGGIVTANLGGLPLFFHPVLQFCAAGFIGEDGFLEANRGRLVEVDSLHIQQVIRLNV